MNNLIYNTTCSQRGHLKVPKETTFGLSFALYCKYQGVEREFRCPLCQQAESYTKDTANICGL